MPALTNKVKLVEGTIYVVSSSAGVSGHSMDRGPDMQVVAPRLSRIKCRAIRRNLTTFEMLTEGHRFTYFDALTSHAETHLSLP